MADSGTTSGPDLLLSLAGDGSALHVRLEGALRDAVRTGRLAAGQRLPSSRALAADLGVSRRLVVEAYAQLISEGYLTARHGSGTRVSELAVPAAPPIATPAPAGRRPPRWDLRPGLPSFADFPRRLWRRAWNEALAGAANADLGYPPGAGHPALRAAVAAYLTRVRGVAATAGNTIVCAGFTQGFDLVCSTLQGAVALDEIGLQHRVPIIERNGLTPLPIPVDEQGLVVDALPESGVAAVLTTPAHQFPLGVVLAPHRREALMAWAARTGALVIEDDYDGEFRFDRRAVGSLQGRSPDSVVYLGSVSKTLAPALRLGWMVCPPYLVDRLAAAKFYADAGTAALDQLALARLIAGGAYDRHVRQSRNRYRANRQALEEAVRDLPLSLAGIPAGLQALATLPPDHDAAALVERAAAEGVGLMSAEVFRLAPGPPALVLGYGNITPHGIDQAMAVLAKVLSG